MTIAKAIALPAVTPDAGVVLDQVVPLDINTLPDVLGAIICGALVPLPSNT